MNTTARLGALLVALVFLAGCVTVEIDTTTLQDPILMNDVGLQQDYEVINEIRRREKAWFLLGIVNIKQPNIEGDLRRAVRQGDAIINTRFRTQYGFGDFLIGVLTLGIIVPRTVVMEADVVQFVE